MTDTSTPLVTSGARRGCGYRQPGGAYFAVPLGPGGRPIEEFLIDPPIVIDSARLGLASVGVTLIERDGVTHVLDIVGREHYPTVASFIDEARRLGVSRRAPRTIDFGRITPASRLLLAHAYADIANAAEFPCDERCPCHVPGHLAAGFAEMCARLWWQEPLEAARHGLALFASFPIPQIEVVKDTGAGSHVATSEMASGAGGGGGAVTGQLQLLPCSPPSQRLEREELERLDGFADAKPSRELREQLRTLGLLQAIVAVPARDGRFRIVDGRRRAKAIAELAEKGEWPERPVVDVLILEGADTERQAVRAGLTLAVHASRGASPASELAAIEAIIEAGRPGGEAATTKQIAAQTGMSLQTIRRRLRLRSLTPGLRRGFDEGRLPASVAEAAARLPAARQEELERALEGDGHLTLAVVRGVTREQTSTSTGELPEGLFAEQEAAWQVTVRGHLTAALAAIPRGDQHAPLARKLTELLAFASRL